MCHQGTGDSNHLGVLAKFKRTASARSSNQKTLAHARQEGYTDGSTNEGTVSPQLTPPRQNDHEPLFCFPTPRPHLSPEPGSQ